MKNGIITRDGLTKFVDSIIKDGIPVYGVVENANGRFNYEELRGGREFRLDFDVTLTPPKRFFTPEREEFLRYKISPEIKTEPVFDTRKRVVLGVHPYDMVAINQMDVIWKDKNEDTHYLTRRRNTIIIGVDPERASRWSFWHVMGTYTVESGYDIWLTKISQDRYFVEVASKEGEGLISKYAKLEAVTPEDEARRNEVRKGLCNLCDPSRKMKVSPEALPRLAKESWDHPTWEERAKKCLSCGSCNIVCPTCYCFDVTEDLDINLKGGRRVRLWDGCQLEDFALVAHGENFRAKRVDRFKHRFYRKALYQYERYNQIACVGCGRCSSACLPDIADPVGIVNSL